MPQDWQGFIQQLSSAFSPGPTPEAQYDARMANGMQAGAKAAGIQAHPDPGVLRTVLNALTGYPLPGEVGTAGDVAGAMMLAPSVGVGEILQRAKAAKLNQPIMDAIEAMAVRYPRTMSHVESFSNTTHPLVNGTVGDASENLAWSLNPDNPEQVYYRRLERGRPIAEMRLNPDTIQTADEAHRVLAHELTHVGQRIRAVDRAKRDIFIPKSMLGDTDAAIDDAGAYAAYRSSGTERRAVIAEQNQAIRKMRADGLVPGDMPNSAIRKIAEDFARIEHDPDPREVTAAFKLWKKSIASSKP